MRGVYAITDGSPLPRLEDKVREALAHGVPMLQYREKSSDPEKRRFEATALLRCCREQQIPLIINDDVTLAAEIGADGVHLGRNDGDIELARNILGDKAIIGISCYNELDRAIAAQSAGADYVAFGRFFPSRSKPQTVQAELSLLDEARSTIQLPIVTIGGITAANARPLIEHGADIIAVIDALFGSPDIAARATELNRLFDSGAR
ncbi:MAG: thiamine phosphate synthase [Gammaproteobacteria bacterium]